MRLIERAKALAKRHWPALSIRTILLATFVFVAALPGVGAVALRVYENTLVQQTEAELIAQGAVLAAVYRAAWERPLPVRPATAGVPLLSQAGKEEEAGCRIKSGMTEGGERCGPPYAVAPSQTLTSPHMVTPSHTVTPAQAGVAGGGARQGPREAPASAGVTDEAVDEALFPASSLAPEPPQIDLRADPVLPPAPAARRSAPADPEASAVAALLAPVVRDAGAVTLAGVRVLDARGTVVVGRGDVGRGYAHLPEVGEALAGRAATVLRDREGPASPLEWLSRAVTIRVHHVRPVLADGRVVGAVMLSRSPRGLFVGIWQDRGKIALGIAMILAVLVVLATFLSRGIARPIRDLTRASEAVARGQVSVPEPPATAAVEIRDLYANFAIMAARIDARTRYLRDFAAAVSHEFKTPLTGIRGALELLTEHEMDEAQRRRFLTNAGADADRLARLVQRLLDLARADMAPGAGGWSDPPVAARQAADAVPALAIDAAGADGQVPLAAETLAAVLTILAENSRDAGATRATLTRTPRALRWHDDGPGIAPGDRDRIFTPFFTSRRERGGTGLGLPIARSLLSASGATIDLAESSAGAVFEIGFAIAPARAPGRPPGAPPPPRA